MVQGEGVALRSRNGNRLSSNVDAATCRQPA